jgi:mitogen-activated protein kinase 1/3
MNTNNTTYPCNRTPLREVVIKQERFILPQQYNPTNVIGKGAYGTVATATDSLTNEQVAVKKNKNVFGNGPFSTHIATRVLRELKILSHLKHPNIINLRDVIIPSSFHELNDVYLVTDLMETDLRNIIRSKQKLSDKHIQYIMFQILAALNYTHSANILHRDLKPENILINSDSRVKLCDFGLARGINFDENPTMSTCYVQTRWYRAPELLLSHSIVSKQADMWSLGCIFAELLTGSVLFRGASPVDQIEKIINLLGTPEAKNVRGSPQGLEFVARMRRCHGRDFSEIFPGVNPLAIDLLRKMLEFNPECRISAADAIKHPYMAGFYEDSVVTTCPTKFDFSFEDSLSDMSSIKIEMFNTIMHLNGHSYRIRSNNKEDLDVAMSESSQPKKEGMFSSLISTFKRVRNVAEA